MKKFYAVRRKLEILSEEADEKESMDTKECSEDRVTRMESLAEKREEESAQLSRQAENSYCEMKSTLQSLQSDLQQSTVYSPILQPSSSSSSKIQPTDQSCVQSRVKLPEIRLPSFGGKTRDWVTFRDMFRSLIHRNEQLTEMDKFTYLRSSLTGEAFQEVNSIEMSAVNYTVAWEVLQTRYENKKLIVKAHLDALFA
ncbi:uncharacterized protein LOC129761249 [Toxorhynchites rutilus septentrionalis]|uniref:uncharacterized protein LOC129761249 n=1 Tax=Toxorhynchites rutilus septentrionalis TaxID=329112 RepID=UPI00247AB8CE|nr:uncharacterized protein LOC129761249 [Toxorhynchites rutilus septentrionalis]